MSVLKKAYKVLTNCEIAVMSAMFIFLSFAVVADVLGRKFFAVTSGPRSFRSLPT